MNKFLQSVSLAALVFVSAACTPKTKVIWSEGPAVEGVWNKQSFTIKICNPPKGTDWNIWGAIYNAKPDVDTAASSAMITPYNGSYFRIYPLAEGSDTLVINYTAARFEKESWAPLGFVLDLGDGKARDVDLECNILPGTEVGGPIFEKVGLGIADMIPQPKKVEYTGNGKTSPDTECSFEKVEGERSEWYRLTFSGGTISAGYSDESGRLYAMQTLSQIKENANGEAIPDLTVEDWPDLEYRGLMLDVGRAFLTVGQMKSFIDAMARYKLNYLQFHLTDDEGWRLEIPGLPELTSFSSVHALPQKNAEGKFDDILALAPSYDGCTDPTDMSSNTNGHYTREEFIDIIKYAWSNGIKVIPEIDTPGHSRSSIAAMEHRWSLNPADDCRLTDPADSTESSSVQMFKSNVLNVALPATYVFIEKVVDEILAMYAEAGVPIEEFHMGGDEVPADSWLGSPLCLALGAEKGISTTAGFKEYFVNRVLDIFEARGLKIDGWQEMALNLSPETKERLRRNLGFLNAWDTLGERAEIPYLLADEGYPTLICNVESTYLDMAYNASKNERGLTWGGFVNEYTTFSLLPYNPAPSSGFSFTRPENVRGVQAHLWGENIRSFENAGYMIFPKTLGIFERGWNAHPLWENTGVGSADFVHEFNRFCTIITEREYPYYERAGMSYRDKLGK